MVMDPYPGYEGHGFSFPCRNVVPKPVQKPHPPMWMACTNRDTIKVAASKEPWRAGLLVRGPRRRRRTGRRSTTGSHQVRRMRADCTQRERHHGLGLKLFGPSRPGRGDPTWTRGFEFFSYAVNALVAHDATCPAARRCSPTSRRRGKRATRRSSPLPKAARRQAAQRHRHPRGYPRPYPRLPRRWRRSGDLPAAGRPAINTSTSARRSESCSPPR